MELKQTKRRYSDSRRGSALIMVVVLTVLLAVIGVLFVMASRIDEMATSSVVYDHELDHAVDSVVELIAQRLTDDLMGAVDLMGVVDERSFDYPRNKYIRNNERRGDNWLGVIEPFWDNGTPRDYTDEDNIFAWRRVSDLTGDIWAAGGIGLGLPAAIYVPADANDLVPADADGDGVIDSLWIRLPGVTTGRGKPIFVAVRIIDNCAMLNLNVAHTLAPGSEGRYLSEIDYERFLRGSDATPDIPVNSNNIRRARRADGTIDAIDLYHDNGIMHIENPGPDYTLFDISDELEIRNRFLLTSLFEARFERLDVANFTLDAGGNIYEALRIPRRQGFDSYGIDRWKWRLDPNNFDDTSGAYVDPANPLVSYAYRYDRRHVCTFYSFDRNLRLGYYPTVDSDDNPVTMIFDPDPWAVCTRIADWNPAIPPSGNYNYNNVETRVQILKLLYAFRAYYLAKYPAENFKQAARRAAQIVANMIDYADDNNPTTEGPFCRQFPDGDGDLFNYGIQTNDNPTFINREVIRQLILEVSKHLYGIPNMIDIDDPLFARYDFGIGVDETIYGYERQPFISEIVRYQSAGNPDYYAIELCNPYDLDISLDNWKIKIGASEYPFAPNDSVIVPAMSAARVPGRLLLYSDFDIVLGAPQPHFEVSGLTIPSNVIVELQRPDPTDLTGTEFITVDKTEVAQADEINTGTDWQASKRDDTEWKFTNASSHTVNTVRTLGRANALDPPLTSEGYQMPVAGNNMPIGTLGDFEMVLTVGNEKGSDPNAKTVTEYVAAAAAASGGGEGDIRTDVYVPQIQDVSPLDYVCFVGRPEGTLPGRINVNTATMEVIRAAIDPDYEALAANIVNNRPFERVTDLLSVPGFKQFATDPNGVGDPEMRGDFEERDWILSRLTNKLTVRSDVFTAYILVRLGHDGPERRMIAIFDRSNVSRPIGNNKPEKPRIIALHPVPDPR